MGDTTVFPAMMDSTMDMAGTAFKLSIGLTGVLTLWLGIMKVGENGGMVNILAKVVGPFFRKLFPEVPKNHPVFGSILMNFSANMLGLDNAATPLGLKAMNQLQELNPQKETASNAQIMFLVLNTSGLTLIPISVMVYRAEAGAANPADVFLPILIATYFSTLVGLLVVSWYQKIKLLNGVVLLYLGVLSAIIAGIIAYFKHLSSQEGGQDLVAEASNVSSSVILMSIIVAFIALAAFRKVNVYESFIDGAKEGFNVAIKIIPYLVAMLVAIAVFRASGAMDYLIEGMAFVVDFFAGFFGYKADPQAIEALPTAIMKPLSGSGARGLMVDTFATHGVDSFTGKLASTFQGSTDTTFYVLAVYFGSVGIKNTRYAVTAGLLADLAGVIAAIVIAYIFFG